jgi:hypothetical protein
LRFAAGIILLLRLISRDAVAQSSKPGEYQVKAVYLYNFARFAAWPEASEIRGAPSFNICVLGEDSFGAALDSVISGETIDHKQAVVKRISRTQDAVQCRVLFVSSSEESRWKEILPKLERLNVLTVSDMPQFSRRGGMIHFQIVANKVRFEVNLAATERAGLELSSELLKLAIQVNRTP